MCTVTTLAAAVPEPASLTLLGLAAIGMIAGAGFAAASLGHESIVVQIAVGVEEAPALSGRLVESARARVNQ